MITPQPITQIAVISVDAKRQTVHFHATEEAVEKVREVQCGEVCAHGAAPSYELAVSPLFSFDQVVEWLRELEEDSRGPF